MSKDQIKPGEQLTLAQINRIRKQAQAGQSKAVAADDGDTAQPKDMTVLQIKEALAAKGIEIPEGVTKKADLQALLDDSEQGGT